MNLVDVQNTRALIQKHSQDIDNATKVTLTPSREDTVIPAILTMISYLLGTKLISTLSNGIGFNETGISFYLAMPIALGVLNACDDYYKHQQILAEQREYSVILDNMSSIKNAQIKEVPTEMECSISHEIATNPVHIINKTTGQVVGNLVYEWKHLEKWIKKNGTIPCPVIPFDNEQFEIVKALEISKEIDQFMLEQLDAVEQCIREHKSETPNAPKFQS